jgi:hypothetical protein
VNERTFPKPAEKEKTLRSREEVGNELQKIAHVDGLILQSPHTL